MTGRIPYHFKLDELPLGDTSVGWESRQAQWGGMNVGYYKGIPAGFDSGPYFRGLAGDLCQSPHWGYVIRGRLLVRYPDREETIEAGELFYSPAGHSVLHLEETDMIEISPVGALESVMQVWRANAKSL